MTETEFDEASETYEMDDAYGEYIMEHSAGDRLVCNGDTLIRAMEDGYLWDSFKEHMIEAK